jgi:hypothetical protein
MRSREPCLAHSILVVFMGEEGKPTSINAQ